MQQMKLSVTLLLGVLVMGLAFACQPPVKPPADGVVVTDSGTGDTTTDEVSGCTSDAECTDPAKPFCNAGLCVAQQPCTTDADCTDPAKPKCTSGVCDAVPGGCTSDADCPDPTKPTCDTTTGQCVGKSGCKTDADCTNPGEICDAKTGQCTPGPTGCKTDADCAAGEKCNATSGRCVPTVPGCKVDADCAAGEKCDTTTGRCIPGPTGCQTDADCKDPAKPVCNPTNGQCQPKGGCKTDTDCTDPAKPICDAATAQCTAAPPGCVTDDDCKDPGKSKCISGVCSPECQADADCKTPGKTKCKAGVCAPECAADGDCTDPSRPVCTQGTCSPKGGCKSDKDCPATAQSHCELSSGKCVACVVDTHCKSNQICDNKTYTCTLKPGSCLSDINCTDKSRPYCVNSACVACRTDSECQRLYSCLNGACQLTGCNSDADCAADPTNKRCAPNKKCVLCTADAHCGAGQFCDMTSYTCAKKPACTTNADCKAPVPYCDATSKACVACTTNSQCKKDPNAAGLAVCSKGQCLGCQADKDCNLGFLCKAGTCIEGCNSNRDCPRTASICSSALKKCVECAQNSDCSSGSCDQAKGVCNYKCTQKDRTDSGCYQRDPNKRYCDGVTSTCVACIPRKYSPSYAYDIGCNTTNPRCVPGTRKCVKCLQDSDCPVSSGALKAVCDTATNTCSECKTSSDCRRGLVCSKGTCTSGCLADTDCPRGKVCGASNQCVDCSAKSPGCATGLVCDTKGERCVECVADKDCKTGEKCDTNIGRCLGLTGRTQCEPCNNATQCATGHTCITSNLIVNNTTVTETSCLKKCTSNSDCGTGYTCCSASNNLCNTRTYPNRKGHCWPNYARGGSTTSGEGYVYAATCRGSLTQGKACTTSGYGNTCGSGGISYNGRKYAEALCDVSAKVCRLPCSSNYPCQQGYTCECPAGATERNSYCYIGNRYYPKRCVK